MHTYFYIVIFITDIPSFSAAVEDQPSLIVEFFHRLVFDSGATVTPSDAELVARHRLELAFAWVSRNLMSGSGLRGNAANLFLFSTLCSLSSIMAQAYVLCCFSFLFLLTTST